MKSAMELFCKNWSAEASSILAEKLNLGMLRRLVVGKQGRWESEVEVGDGKQHLNFGEDVIATELWSIALCLSLSLSHTRDDDESLECKKPEMRSPLISHSFPTPPFYFFYYFSSIAYLFLFPIKWDISCFFFLRN